MDRITALQLFVRAVETGSFSKAARDAQLTQPTVTKQVAALEKKLGARLLNRNTRGLSLTEVGALYYEKCKAILEQFEEADNVVNLRHTEVSGRLRIGASVAFGRRVVTPLMLEFMRRHPQLHVDLGFVDTYVDLVAQGIDVAIRMGQLADSSLGARYLGDNPWIMVASPAYLKKQGAPKTPGDLSKHNVLLYSTVHSDDRLHFVTPDSKRITVTARGNLRSNNLSAVLAAVRAEMGVAALPNYVAASSLRDGNVVPILTSFTLPAQEIHAVYPSPKQVAPKVSTLILFLQNNFQGEWWKDS
ncbi:MAG: LysR family transcriptional regulator [Burkholderiales bacterium]